MSFVFVSSIFSGVTSNDVASDVARLLFVNSLLLFEADFWLNSSPEIELVYICENKNQKFNDACMT
jgi:hypothetical protein